MFGGKRFTRGRGVPEDSCTRVIPDVRAGIPEERVKWVYQRVEVDAVPEDVGIPEGGVDHR